MKWKNILKGKTQIEKRMLIQEVASEVNIWRLHEAAFIVRLRGGEVWGSRGIAFWAPSSIRDGPELQS